MSRAEQPLIAVVGPTACGKTRRAVDIALAFDGEIISGDSRQVYRGMDIGTGKDLDEYGSVPHHLIDVAEAGEVYDLYRFMRDFEHAYADIRARGRRPILCGGTGLYVETALRGTRLPEVPANEALRRELEGKSLDQLTEILKAMRTLHNTTDVDSARRAIRAIEIARYYAEHPDEEAAAMRPAKPLDAIIIGLDIDRDTRRERIARRLDQRLHEGMVDEVRALIDRGVNPSTLIAYGLEYRFITRYLLGELSFDEMRTLLYNAICQFAKRQMTWWRGMERRGLKINWLPHDLPTPALIETVRTIRTELPKM